MATAQNGWPVIPLTATTTFLAPNGKLVYCHPLARDILGYLAWRWHFELTPLPAATYNEGDSAADYRKGVRDGLVVIHGWRPGTKIAGTNVYSNHGSGLAMDINGHLHPYEYTSPKPYRDGFTSAQRTTLRSFRGAIRNLGGNDILRIGLDFASPRRDAMHLELWGTRAQLDRCAAAIRSAGWIIPTRRGQIAEYQRIVGAKADDRHGPATTAAVRAYQGRLGVPATGRWDVATRTAHERRGPEPDPLVAKAQALLNGLGAGLVVDGRPGPRTAAAIAKYASEWDYSGDHTDFESLITHLEETMSTLKKILTEVQQTRSEVQAVRKEQAQLSKRLGALVDTVTGLAEDTVRKLLATKIHGFTVEWWLRLGWLGSSKGHRQWPADPDSPADLWLRVAKVILGREITPYDGTQRRDDEGVQP